MNKFAEYTTGRNDGLLLAKEIVMNGGLEALEKELKFRGATKINTSLSTKELDRATESVKQICFGTIMVAMLAVLHDDFGFGEKRLTRVAEKFDKVSAYLQNGWLYWMDMIDSLEKDLSVKITNKYMTSENMGKHWAHPECGDIYEETDWVDPVFWEAELKLLGYSERKGEEGMEILDENKNPVLSYDNKFDQIGMYDVLRGILFAKEHYGIT